MNFHEFNYCNSFEEELFLKEIELCQEDEDLYDTMGIEIRDLSSLSQTKLQSALKTLRNLLKENNEISNKNEALSKRLKEMVLQREKDWNTLSILTEKLEFIEKSLKESQEENHFLKGEHKFLSKLELSALIEYEKTLLMALSNISEFKNKKLSEQAERLDILKKDNESSKKCIICAENSISILIQPCNHVCLCFTCSQRVIDCPLDRIRITGITEIFLPI